MVRLVHTGDIHFDEHRRLGGAKRYTSDGRPFALWHTAQVVTAMMGTAARDGVDVWVVAGDVFERPQPTALEEKTAIELFTKMAQHAPVLIIAGNHDIPLTRQQADGLECLRQRERSGIWVVDRPCLVSFHDVDGYGTKLEVLDPAKPRDIAGERAVFACVPYPRRGELAALMPDLSKEERHAAASEALRSSLLTLRAQASAREVPRVLVYHGSVTGARINDQPRSLLGDISLEPEDLQGWSYVAMGHIHQQQELAPGAWYSGSIDRCSFGEELEPKGVLRVTLGAQMQCEVSTLDPGALQYRTLEYLDLIKVRDSHPTDAEAAGKGFEAETVYRVKDKLNPADASEARRLIGAYQEAGVWIADAVTVVEDARVRDEDATGQEDNRTFLRRWLSRQDLDPIAASAGITADQLIEDVVKLHDELEDAA